MTLDQAADFAAGTFLFWPGRRRGRRGAHLRNGGR